MLIVIHKGDNKKLLCCRTYKGRLFFLLSIVSLFLLFLPSVGSAAEHSADLYGQLKASSLEVIVDGRLAGNGCFVTSYGLALTAAHVIKNAAQVEVRTNSFGRLKAIVVATDPGHDLALLRVERLAGLFPHRTIAETEPSMGDTLYLFGSPLYRHDLMLTGHLAKPETQFEWNSTNRRYTEVFPVAAMTPEGLSGAPWVNAKGDIVGMQSGMMTWKGSLMGVAFMSPFRALKHIVISGKDVNSPALGAVVANQWEQPVVAGADRGKHPDGVYVVRTFDNGTLANMGILNGDTLLKINGERLNSREQLLHIIKSQKIGAALDIDVLRYSGEIDLIKGNLY